MIPVALGLMVGERRRAFVDRHGPQIGLLIKLPSCSACWSSMRPCSSLYLAGLPPLELVRLYLVVFLQMMGGYLLGFAITTLLGLDYAASITMTYAATMRNNGRASLIAVSYFSPPDGPAHYLEHLDSTAHRQHHLQILSPLAGEERWAAKVPWGSIGCEAIFLRGKKLICPAGIDRSQGERESSVLRNIF